MADFSRIQVTPPEEEDIVIMAGAVEEPLSEPDDRAPSEEALTIGEEAASASAALEEEATATVPRESEASYRETTLEDLRRTRMSGMQKAIVALAIVAVLAFIIWYVLLR